MQGRFGTETVYSDDPVEVAMGFCSAGARWLHVVDLDGAKSGAPANRELVLEVIRLVPRLVQASGGLTTIEDVEEVLAAGANRAVLSSRALEDEAALRKACGRYGERIAASLEVGSSTAAPGQPLVRESMPLPEAVRIFSQAGAAAFIRTDLSRDSAMTGPNLEGLEELARLTPLPVIAAGGVGSLPELEAIVALRRLGVRGAIVGRALYEQKFGIAEANRIADAAGTEGDPGPFPSA